MEDWAASVETICKALADVPLFEGCDEEALQDIAGQAACEELPVGAELTPMSGVIFVVLDGAVQVRSGVGPLSIFGPGGSLNASGLLMGKRSDPVEPVCIVEPIRSITGAQETSCIENLCPHSILHQQSALKRPSSTVRGRGRLTITGAPRGSAKRKLNRLPSSLPLNESDGGGAVLAAITLEQLEERFAEKASAERFQANRTELLKKWSMIQRTTLFQGASDEILFAIAAVSTRQEVEADHILCKEGNFDESIIIVHEGEATVDKKVSSRSGKAVESMKVGRIGRGAIIGDITLICAKVSRCATIQAVSKMVLLNISPPGLLKVLRRFPGITSCFEDRIKETVSLLAEALPSKDQVLSSLKLFSMSDQNFLGAVASGAERHVFYCGDVLKREGMADGTLYVVEFGACTVESVKRNLLLENEISVGSCMGERTLLGAEKANATVFVSTPLAVMLTVEQGAFNCALRRFPWDGQRLENLKGMSGETVRNHDASSLKIFHASCQDFVREISAAMAVRCFLPGQTVIVQGTADAGQMFAIRGGRVCIEVDGKREKELSTGDVFGELAMVGVVRRRSSTVRAVTFCVMIEIPREAFLASIDRHPRERQRFEAIATNHEVAASSITWPILREMPHQLVYMVNLYAERRICIAGDSSLSAQPARDAAIMVMQGSLVEVDDSGEELPGEVIEGQCFNEQALLDLPSGHTLRPKTTCEVQILTKEVWDKVLAEFPELHSKAKQKILQETAGKAEEKLHAVRGGIGVLRRSALFRAVSDEMAVRTRECLEEQIFRAGQTITEEGSKDDYMYWVLNGAVQVTSSSSHHGRKASKSRRALAAATTWTWQADSGHVLSESVAAGICERQPHTLQAVTDCLVQVLSRKQMLSLLQDHPGDRWPFNAICDEVKQNGTELSLQERVLQSTFFSQLGREFALALCERLEDVFFAPSEPIFSRDEPCEYGTSCMYVLLAGQAVVEESVLGLVMGRATPGDVVGEAGAFGYAGIRKATVKSWGGSLVHCAKVHGSAIKAAAQRHKVECEAVSDLFNRREVENRSFQEHKKQWLEETVCPALMESSVFSALSKTIVEEIAMLSACVASYSPEKCITVAGEQADCMLLLLEGEVELQAQSGKVVGQATNGAIFGEVVLLGLLMLRTATVVAKSPCKVLAISTKTFELVLARPNAAASHASIERLRQSRLEQISRGMPITGLATLKASKDDVCLRTMALQAERLNLIAGAVWTPRPDSSPSGPHFGFLVKGHAGLQNVEEAEDRPIMALPEGCVINEGLVAKYNAQIRGITGCEAYRVCQTDFELAATLSPTGCAWYGTFQMLLKESRRHLTARLQTARGALEGQHARKKDSEIRVWRLDRELSMDHAGRVKQHRPYQLHRPSPFLGVGGACLRTPSSTALLNRYHVSSSLYRPPSAPSLTEPKDLDGALASMWTSPNRKGSLTSLKKNRTSLSSLSNASLLAKDL